MEKTRHLAVRNPKYDAAKDYDPMVNSVIRFACGIPVWGKDYTAYKKNATCKRCLRTTGKETQ